MALTWSSKRKMYVVAGFLAILFAFLIWKAVPYLNQEPTCFDGKLNGEEEGIDCGGSCELFCSAEALGLVTRWSRFQEVVPGRYNVMALVENQNQEAAVEEIFYEFKLYDKDNIFITRKTGSTYITPNTQTAIFESALQTGNRAPSRIQFKFTTPPKWVTVKRSFFNALQVFSEDKVLTNLFVSPELDAKITNASKFDLFDVDVVALLYDEEGGVIGFSKTLIERINRGETQDVVFTWPEGFDVSPTRIEVTPQFDIFDVK